MADLRITPGAQALAPVAPARSDAVKAAQRAFFNAALTEAQASAPVRQHPQAPAQAFTAAVRPTATASADATPDRMLRPGSILDIKV